MTIFIRARCTLPLLALICFLTLASKPTIAGASPGCEDAEMTGESHVNPASGAFDGVGTIILDGHVHDVSWISVVTSVVAAPDGTLTLTGSHHITSTRDDSIDFTTADLVTAVPTAVPGEYTFSSQLVVVGGTGRIKSGFLTVEGWVDLVNGDVELHASQGSLCPQP